MKMDTGKELTKPAKFKPAFLQATAVIIMWEPSSE